MKKFILFFFALVASVCAFAQGTADFNTLKVSTSYAEEITTADGWVINYSAVQGGVADPSTEANPQFALLGSSTDAVAVCLNGHTAKVGRITSPKLEGGIGNLSFNYGRFFNDDIDFSLKVEVVQNEEVVFTEDVTIPRHTKCTYKEGGQGGEITLPIKVAGDFVLVITNNCPSQKASNGDRISIWNLSWTAQAPLPVNPVVASITAVFPNGNKHVVYSNGEKLTAGAEVPADAISQFDVVSRTENTLVLKAGDQYLHWTSGDNKDKSADLDGLNEDFDETLNTLTLAPATLQGCSTSATWGKTEEDVQGLYRLQGMGTNGRLFDFTLRENDDAWIAGDPGNIFFDTNRDGNGCRTSFFEIVVEEEAAAVEPVLSADDVHAKHSYYIYTDARGGLTIMDENATNLVGTAEAGVGQEVDATNPLQQFAFVNYEDALYLYSVGAGKFVNAAGKGILEDTPKTPILFKNAGEDDVMLYFDDKHNFNLGGSKQVTIDGWSDKDAGNSFHIMLADSFDPTPVIAALEEAKNGSAVVTYNYTIGGRVWKTVTSEQKKGETVAAPAEQAFVNIVSYDEATVAEDLVVNVVCEEALPFTTSTEAKPVYGYLRGHSNQIRYIYVNEEGAGMDTGNLQEEMTEFADNYLWFISGNLLDGFQLHNKAYGVLRATEGQTSVNGEANSVWQLRAGSAGSKLTENIFSLWAEGVTYMNCQGGLKYWDNNDAGSTFTFNVVETEEPAPATVDVVYTVKFNDEVVKTATVTETIGAAPSYDVAAPAYVQVAGMPKTITAETKAVELTTTLDETVPFEVGNWYVVYFRNGACRYYWNDSNEGVGNEVRWNGNPSDISSREELESYTETAKWEMGGNWATGFTFTNAVTGKTLTAPAAISGGTACNLNEEPATGFDIVQQTNGHFRFYPHGDAVNFLAHTSHGSHRVTFWNKADYGVTSAEEGGASCVQFELIEKPAPVETFPMEGVAYKFKNVDSQLYIKVVEDAEQCVTLGQTPDEMYFTAVEGGWAISNSKGYQLGSTAKGWNIGNTATPIVWTIEEVEGGYAFHNEKGYLGFDTAAAGMKAFRDKEVVKHHGVFNIWKYDEEEIIVVPEKTLEETWANIHNLLAEAEAIKTLNEVTVTYDADGYFEDFTSPIVGKVGYKKHDDVWAVCDGADYVNSFVSYFETAAEADAYLADFGGLAALEEIIANVVNDYNDAEVVLPEPGKTYVIRNYPYTYTDEFSYAYYYNGEKLALSESANATTAEYMWTISEPVKYSYFDADLNVIEEYRYQFVNAADNTKFMSWRGAGTDNYAGVTTNASDANSKWYLTGKKVDGTATPAYGTLALRTNADGNQYRTAVVDMRKSTDHLSKSNGDHFDATYSSWFIFEEVEVPVSEWDGNEPVVEVQDDTTVKVTFTDAHSVEASNLGVLAAIYDEQGDVYGIVFNDLFGETVEFGSDCATLHFKKISEINAELAASAKSISSKVLSAVDGVDVKGKVVICGKSFKIDGEALYTKVIVKDFDFNAGGITTGIDAIATDANVKVFDLQGRRVAVPAKGIFVREGRKVVR